VSKLTMLEFRARMVGEGSLRGVSMKRLGWIDTASEWSTVPRMARCSVRRTRVLRDWYADTTRSNSLQNVSAHICK